MIGIPDPLVLAADDLARLERLRVEAEARPRSLEDTARQQRQRLVGRRVGDPTSNCVMLGGAYIASYVVEDWPDGRWRRLTVTHHRAMPDVCVVARLMEVFGFGISLSQAVCWRSREGARGRGYNVTERIVSYDTTLEDADFAFKAPDDLPPEDGEMPEEEDEA